MTVNAALTPYGNTLDIGAGSFGLSAIGLRGSEVRSVDGGTLNGDEFTFDSGSEIASLALANGTVTLRRCAETAIEIVESDALDGYILEMGGLPLYLSARYRSVLRRNETPKVSWGSSSDDVVSVDADGTVRGLMSGTASVTAQSAEGESASVDITVQRTVAVLVLKTTQSSLEAGIGRETVFPSMRYDGTGKLTDNEFAVEVAYPRSSPTTSSRSKSPTRASRKTKTKKRSTRRSSSRPTVPTSPVSTPLRRTGCTTTHFCSTARRWPRRRHSPRTAESASGSACARNIRATPALRATLRRRLSSRW